MQIKSFIDEEVLLFGTKRNCRLLGARLEASHEAACRFRKSLQTAEERSFLVESFTGIATERRRDAKRSTVAVALDEGRASRVPGRVAAGFEGGTESATREARCIRFAHNQILAAQHHDGLATARFEEAVVLLGGRAGKRLEPVRKMRGTAVHRPTLHGVSDIACDARIQSNPFVNRREKLFANFLRKVGAHGFGIEYVLTVEIDVHGSGWHRGAYRRSCDVVDGFVTAIVHGSPVFSKVITQRHAESSEASSAVLNILGSCSFEPNSTKGLKSQVSYITAFRMTKTVLLSTILLRYAKLATLNALCTGKNHAFSLYFITFL